MQTTIWADAFRCQNAGYKPPAGITSLTQSIGGPGLRRPIDKQMTYEMGFTTERLRIYLDSYAIYSGKPMTAENRDEELTKRAHEAAVEAEAGKR